MMSLAIPSNQNAQNLKGNISSQTHPVGYERSDWIRLTQLDWSVFSSGSKSIKTLWEKRSSYRPVARETPPAPIQWSEAELGRSWWSCRTENKPIYYISNHEVDELDFCKQNQSAILTDLSLFVCWCSQWCSRVTTQFSIKLSCKIDATSI